MDLIGTYLWDDCDMAQSIFRDLQQIVKFLRTTCEKGRLASQDSIAFALDSARKYVVCLGFNLLDRGERSVREFKLFLCHGCLSFGEYEVHQVEVY